MLSVCNFAKSCMRKLEESGGEAGCSRQCMFTLFMIAVFCCGNLNNYCNAWNHNYLFDLLQLLMV